MSESPAKHVLVIDDDAMNRELLEAILDANGFDVILARHAQEGIEKATQVQPEIILLDMRMPDMDGVEACEHLKAGDTTRHIPVIMLTGSDSRSDHKRIQSAGADAMLLRPFEFSELIDLISSLTTGKGN